MGNAHLLRSDPFDRCARSERIDCENARKATARNMDKDQNDHERTGAAILLHPSDNVVVCRRNVVAGESLIVEGHTLIAKGDVELGHKIARNAIPAGSPVVKYGMSIGVSTRDILPGEWVHLHNMKSDYIASHTRQSRSGQ